MVFFTTDWYIWMLAVYREENLLKLVSLLEFGMGWWFLWWALEVPETTFVL